MRVGKKLENDLINLQNDWGKESKIYTAKLL